MHTRGKTGEKKALFVRTFRTDAGLKCRALLSDRYFPIRTLDMVAIALGLATGKIKSSDGGEETAIKGAYLFDKHLSVTGCTVGMVNPGFAFDLRNPDRGIIKAERKSTGDGGQPVFHYPGGASYALGVVLGKTGDAEIDKTAAKNAWMFDQRISVEEVNVGFVNPRYAFDLRHPSQGIIEAERVTMNDGIPTFHYPGGSAYTLGGKWTGKKENQHLVLPAARISNSETGGGSAVIEPMMIEVACINGMTLMKAMKRNHLGGLMESADVYESDAKGGAR